MLAIIKSALYRMLLPLLVARTEVLAIVMQRYWMASISEVPLCTYLNHGAQS